MAKVMRYLGAAGLYIPVCFSLCFWGKKKLVLKNTTNPKLTDGYKVILSGHEIFALVE